MNLGILMLEFGGLLLLAAGFLLLSGAAPTAATPPADHSAALRAALASLESVEALPVAQVEDAEYVGARRCSTCHDDIAERHATGAHQLALVEAKDATILGDFAQGEDVRMVTFEEGEDPRPFDADDIEYVIGSGRHVQRYLYKVRRNEFAVLPAEWNVDEGVWQPYRPAESWPDPAYDFNTNCAGCHTTAFDADDGKWEEDGVTCEGCHGPGSIHRELAGDLPDEPTDADLEPVRTSIVNTPDAQICGACHSQGTEPENGLPFPVAYRPGGALLSDTTFALVAPDDTAHWRASGHGASQNMAFNEWMASGHATALDTMKASPDSDDSCLTCHSADATWREAQAASVAAGERLGSAPAPASLENATYGVTCASCHSVHEETGFDYGLAQEPVALCESCHSDAALNGTVHHPSKEMYEGVELVQQVRAVPSNHLEAGANCVSCHMPESLQNGQTWYGASHTMAPARPGTVVEGQPDSCTGCHSDLSAEYMASFIEETQARVLDRVTTLQVAVGQNAGAPDWTRRAVAFVVGDGSAGIHNYAYASSLMAAVEVELGLSQVTVPISMPVRPVEDPTECAECHAEEYNQWQVSPHANSSMTDTFLQMYASQGRPTFCMSCHASGYDPRTEEYAFEGVTCGNCHVATSDAPHPPGPVEVASDSAVCGSCHTGAHAPTYDEWLVSDHSAAGIDCVDCHTPHNNGLKLDNDVNATCGSCHEEALVDEIHMGEDMTCVDCHMSRQVAANNVQVVATGHGMGIDPSICASCHGNTHLLSQRGQHLSEEENVELVALKQEVTGLQAMAAQNLNSGIVGGALGALVLVVILFVILRLGRLR